jgi:hypothetical protein
VTIREVTRRWLEGRRGEVKDGTHEGYERAAANIVGPLLVATTQQRSQFSRLSKRDRAQAFKMSRCVTQTSGQPDILRHRC